jgi:ABC-type transport system involved in multi-copper enzyme maturation permease subunit
MTAFWAIVLDTARQSRQQVVFVLLAVFLLITCAIGVIVPGHMTDDNGENRVSMISSDEPAELFEGLWRESYLRTLVREEAKGGNPFDPDNIDVLDEKIRAKAEALEAEHATPLDRRAAEAWVHIFASAIFTVSMWLFIIACSGYFPNMLESGAVDIILAKPLDRLRIYLGKYVGGIALYGLAVTLAYLILFIGVGFRTQVWVGSIFLVLPLQIFVAAVLYAMLSAFGVWTRSSTLCVLVGLVFYVVVDSVLAGFVEAQRFGVFKELGWEWLDKVGDVYRLVMPNFSALKDNATLSVFNVPVMEWQPFFTAAAWLVICLGIGYWRFRRTDY